MDFAMPASSPEAPRHPFYQSAKRFTRIGTIVGVIAFSIGLLIALMTWRDISGMESVEGKGVRFRKFRHLIERHPNRHRIHPPYALYTVNGLDYVTGCRVLVEYEGMANPSQRKIGDPIPVYYPPDNPIAGRVGAFADIWFAPMAVTGAGTAITLIALILGFGASKSPPELLPAEESRSDR